MPPYTVYINEAALATAPASASQRIMVMRYITSLADNPSAAGDFSETDHAGRTVEVKLVGRFAVTFWADHAVREIEVTHIKPADQ